MSNDVMISVENLSKRYRIGAKEERYKTLRDAIVDVFKAPIKNFARLRKLTKFDDKPSKEPNPKFRAPRSLVDASGSRPHAPFSMPSSENDDTIWALRDVSLEVQEGEVVGIIGRNGAGKTTLLKILSRITEPTSGDVKLYGRVSSLLEVGTGFHPELTGRENVFLNGTILGMRRAEIDRKFDEIVEFSGVEKFIDTPVKRYSSGMQVRLAFAVAAHLEPEILLIDEVLAVGDMEFQKKCLGKMKDVAGEGRAVLFVSHNMAAVQQLCDYGIILSDGVVDFDGSSEDAVAKYLQNNTPGAQKIVDLNFEIDETKPIQFTRIYLTNCQQEIKTIFEHNEHVIVNIDFLKRQALTPCSIRMKLHDSKYNHLFTTTSDDVDPNSLHLLANTRHTFMLKIPKALLLPGDYRLSFTIRGYNEDSPFDKSDECFFEIVDHHTLRGINSKYKKSTLIAPEIKWRYVTF